MNNNKINNTSNSNPFIITPVKKSLPKIFKKENNVIIDL